MGLSPVIFSNGYESYQVNGIVYAGPVHQIPEQHRRNAYTHSFKIITGLGAAFLSYKDEDNAKKARGALSVMLERAKPGSFRAGYEYLDPSGIVSFNNVVQFKKPVDDCTHGYMVSILTHDEKNREVWLKFKTEDHAVKSRKAMWATLHSFNGVEQESRPVEQKTAVAASSDGMPF
jgi:hypothetical protein